MLIVLLIRGVTLPGASLGIEFYLYPDLGRLADPQVQYNYNMSNNTGLRLWDYKIGLIFSVCQVLCVCSLKVVLFADCNNIVGLLFFESKKRKKPAGAGGSPKGSLLGINTLRLHLGLILGPKKEEASCCLQNRASLEHNNKWHAHLVSQLPLQEGWRDKTPVEFSCVEFSSVQDT